jgi:hypothetical protein
VLLEENTYLRKRLEAHAADVERAEKRLAMLETQRGEQDTRYGELMERYRQAQNQMMGCECGAETDIGGAGGRKLDMPLQVEHLNKPAYSAFQLRSSECRKLLNELTTMIFSHERERSAKAQTL